MNWYEIERRLNQGMQGRSLYERNSRREIKNKNEFLNSNKVKKLVFIFAYLNHQPK